MIAIVILAAGSSSRMGQPKQNLLLDGRTLLQHVIETAKELTDLVVVTLGASIDEIKPTLENLNLQILDNKNWKDGMATSITLAVGHLLRTNNDITQIMFLLCDQPYVGSGLLNELVRVAGTTEKGIIGSAYSGTIGVPVCFKKKHFPELLRLTGKEGAKKLIDQFAEDVETVAFPAGDIDIDTPEDLKKLLSGN